MRRFINNKHGALARAKRQSGFTLLEILAAFVIFAVAFTATMQIVSGSVRNTARSAEYTQAALWAKSKLDAVGLDPPLEDTIERGDFDDDYRYEMDIQLIELVRDSEFTNPVDLELYRVDLKVLWGEGGNERSAVFSTMRSKMPEP